MIISDFIYQGASLHNQTGPHANRPCTLAALLAARRGQAPAGGRRGRQLIWDNMGRTPLHAAVSLPDAQERLPGGQPLTCPSARPRLPSSFLVWPQSPDTNPGQAGAGSPAPQTFAPWRGCEAREGVQIPNGRPLRQPGWWLKQRGRRDPARGKGATSTPPPSPKIGPSPVPAPPGPHALPLWLEA